jgi:hypothetical protein
MALCLDGGSGNVPYAVSVVASSVASVGECNSACPTGHLCVAVGSGELLRPTLDPVLLVEGLSAGFVVMGIPLLVAWSFAAVLSLLRR